MEIAGNLIKVEITKKTFVKGEGIEDSECMILKICIMDKRPNTKKDVIRYANLSCIKNISKYQEENKTKAFKQSVEYWSKHKKNSIFRVINISLQSMVLQTTTGKDPIISISANFNQMDILCLAKARDDTAPYILKDRVDLMSKYDVENKDEDVAPTTVDIELT